MENYIIGIDIGGTYLRVGMVTEDGQLHNLQVESTSTVYSEGNPLEKLQQYIEKYTEKYSMGTLLGIAIGFPSTISKDKKTVYSSPNLKGFDNINVVDPFEAAFNVPIFINKDVNYLLHCEISKRNVVNPGIVLGFYIGTGFGNAVYVNDYFLEGLNGVAGELGHIPVWHSKEKCGCGNTGCIECHASGKKLAEIHQTFFRDTAFSELFSVHRNEPVLKEFIDVLAIPIATEINIFDPDCIIIGGGVPAMADFPKEDFEACIYGYTRKPFPANGLNIVYAQMNQEAGVLGGAFYAYKQLNKRSNS